jgi:ABC-type antimicrobial peptide transport system ATPase subunit
LADRGFHVAQLESPAHDLDLLIEPAEVHEFTVFNRHSFAGPIPRPRAGSRAGGRLGLAEAPLVVRRVQIAVESLRPADYRPTTAVGAGGEALTDAQAQQIALARLLLADPRVLILDEATSQMAPGSARQLERSLAAVLKGRTVISIAHRLHTAYDADRIIVVEDGRIVEDGSHQDLIVQNGAYARLWSSWL